MLGKFKIIAGDFRKDIGGQFVANTLILHKIGGWGVHSENYDVSQIEEIEAVSQDNERKTGSTIGWGVAGALVAGPLGALAAGYVGGKKDEVTFICRFFDGEEFVSIMKKGLYAKLSTPFLLKKS
ncbi:MAG: hypothetical protein JKX85_08010 [Phycisphaeraceae bacterium]|nr:hypothetical protein [Phycisphaeraceae bacterium]